MSEYYNRLSNTAKSRYREKLQIVVLVSPGNHEENGTVAKNAEALEKINYY